MKKVKNVGEFIVNIFNIIRIIFRSAPLTIIKLLVCNVLLGVATSLNVYLWKYLVDSATYSLEYGKIGKTIIWVGSIGACTEIMNLFNRLSIYYREIAQERMNCYINETVINKIHELDMSYFDDPQTYDTMEKVSNESGSRCVSILVMLVMLIQYFTTLIGVTAVITSLSCSVSVLACLIMIPIFYISISIAYKQYQIYITRVQKLRMVDYLTDLCLKYENIKELKIYNAVLYLKHKITEIYEKNISEDKKYKKCFLYKFTATDLGQLACSTGIKIFILYRAILEKKTIGDFTMYISALDNMENSISSILDAVSSLYSDNLYIENLLRLLKMKKKLKYGTKEFSVKNFRKIEFENVWFRYPHSDSFVLKGISLKLERGKSYALVGLNGSGKTTFIKLLLRLYDPQKGRILIDGVNIKEYNLESLYRNIGVIFQDFIRYPLTVNENIGIGDVENIDDFKKIENVAQTSGASNFIRKLPNKFQTILEKEWDEGSELSGGQWQKVAISRALMRDSSILVLDEPSSALDPQAESDILQKMQEMMRGKMSLFITHRFSNMGIIDKIFVMQEGKIIEFGTHDELMKREGEYYTLYKLQVDSYRGL